MARGVDRMTCAPDRDRAGHRSPLLDVSGDLVGAHAGGVRIAVGGTRRLPDDVEPRAPGAVAETEPLERAFPLDREAREREAARLDRGHGRAMIDDGVHHRAPLGDEQEEVRLAEVRMDAGPEDDADLGPWIVEGEPVALVPQRQGVFARDVPRIVLGRGQVGGARHHDPPLGAPGAGSPSAAASRWVQGLLVSRSGVGSGASISRSRPAIRAMMIPKRNAASTS